VKKIALSLFVVAASGAYVWDQAGRAAHDDLLALPLATGDDRTGGILQPASTRLDEPAAAVRPALFLVNQPGPDAPAGKPPADDSVQPPPVADVTPVTVPSPPVPTLVEAVPASVPPPDAPALADAAATPSSLPPPPVNMPLPRPRPAYKDTRVSAVVTPVAMTVPVRATYTDGAYVGPITDAYYGLMQIEAIIQGGQLVGIKVLKYPSDRRTSVYINRQALPMLRDEVVSAQSARVDIISGATLSSEAFIRSLDGALRKAKS
jgi:uncharacterized protein with FMN-binding domain